MVNYSVHEWNRISSKLDNSEVSALVLKCFYIKLPETLILFFKEIQITLLLKSRSYEPTDCTLL